MQNLEPVIIWEKWVDPYGNDLDTVEWPGYDNEDIINDDDHNENNIKYKKINVIATTMGIIPFNEHTDCTKIFNFWIGHTNFDITKNIAQLLQTINGVETLDVFTRYRFRISFGKAFEDRDIINNINNKIKEFL